MAFDQGQRQMHDVSSMGISCSMCGKAITELPFQPDPARVDSLKCRDCMQSSRPSRGGFGGGAPRQRQMHDVTSMGIVCASCGVAITQLPFMPRSSEGIYCSECNRSRNSR